MSKNIYKYKIRYTNFLKTGGSSFVNETNKTNEKGSYSDTLNNMFTILNSANKPGNSANQQETQIKFKDRKLWPYLSSEWSSEENYVFLEDDFVWEENDVGKTISVDQISFNNGFPNPINPDYYIKVKIGNKSISFKPEAFEDQYQERLKNLFQDNNNLNDNEMSKGISSTSSSKHQINDDNEMSKGISSTNSEDKTNNNEVSGIKFKDKKDWISTMWSSQGINSTHVNNLIFDQNGEGNIISWNQIEFNNSDLKYYIKINNKVFMPEAFIEEDQDVINYFIQNKGFSIRFKNKNDFQGLISDKSLNELINLEIWEDGIGKEIIYGKDFNINRREKNRFYIKLKKNGNKFRRDAFTEDSQTTINFLYEINRIKIQTE